MGVGRLSAGCGKADWRVWVAVWRGCGGYLEGVGRLSGVGGRLSGC